MIESENAIEIRGLRKRYRGGKGFPPHEALKGIDLDVPRGSFFGLLGPNGAGKSTLINTLAGLVNKTAGQVSIWGFDIDKSPRNARNSIGIVPQEISFDAFFTPREALELQAGLYGVRKSERRTDQILEAMHLSDKADAYSRALSGGMKRRLLVAKAMVHSPPILVLDEPTAGVDLELRQQLWDHIRALKQGGVTIMLTTHYLEEAEQMCDRIAIMNHGELIALEKTHELVRGLSNRQLRIWLDTPLQELPVGLEAYRPKLQADGGELQLCLPAGENAGELLRQICALGLQVRDIETDQSGLEEVFIQLTGMNEGANAR